MPTAHHTEPEPNKARMPTPTASPTIPILLLLLPLLLLADAGADSDNIPPPPPSNCSCAAPSPPRRPLPSDFPNLKQYLAYFVIQRFKQTITCDPTNATSTWTGFAPCSYRGFFCDTPPGLSATPTIASVDFNGFRLCAPTLSGFIDALPDLALFHANSNNFSDAIPDLSALPFLYELDLSNNDHSGPFPAAVLPLLQLSFIDLRFNRFAGAVPPSAFNLAAGVLFLNNNLFSQPLPADLGRSSAAFLTLANNAFTGPIPRSIRNASDSLVEVLFLNNRLSGCLPYEIGLLGRATVFDAGFNRITGPIPLSFGCLFNVEQLNLAGNLLYGKVPDVVCRLAEFGNLVNLSLSDNYFTFLGRSCWRLIRTGVLDVRRNCIFGLPEQRSPAECVFFLTYCKYCPWHTYTPCQLAYWKKNVTAANAGDAEEATAAAPGYRTYSAIHQPDGN